MLLVNVISFYFLEICSSPNMRVILINNKLSVNAEVDNGGMPIHPISFKVTLKPSHVDKRQHGVVSFLYYFCNFLFWY